MKTHKRVIAAFVAFAFLTLLQVTAMPLRADQAPDRSGAAVASPDEAPSYIEEEGTAGSGGKKSILPVVLIGLGVAALAAVLVLVVFKTKYDIVGVWTINDTIVDEDLVITFTGNKSEGDLTLQDYIDIGTYEVSGKDIYFEFGAPGQNYRFEYEGQFDGKDKAKGTVKYIVAGIEKESGTWRATRNSTSTGSGALPKSVPTARMIK